MIKLCVIIVCTLFCAVPAWAQDNTMRSGRNAPVRSSPIDGWSNAKFGMIFEQLQKVYSDAETQDLCSVGISQSSSDYDCKFLKLKRVVFGIPWNISFWFSRVDNGLAKIDMASDLPASQQAYEDVKHEMKNRYGVGQEQQYRENSKCESVLRRFNSGTRVRTYEFFANHSGIAYNINRSGSNITVFLKDDSICAGAPSHIGHDRGARDLVVEYRRAVPRTGGGF